MTKTEFQRKTLEVIKNLDLDIYKECERLFDSGAVDTESYCDGYILPKTILIVALENLSDSLKWGANKEEVANLRHF